MFPLSKLPFDIVVDIMDFLDWFEIESEIFLPYFETHRFRRTAAQPIYTGFDLRRSYFYPKSTLNLHYYPRSDLFYVMEPDDYDRVSRLNTFLSTAAGLFVNLVYLDISYSNSRFIPDLKQLRSLNCSYTKVEELPET